MKPPEDPAASRLAGGLRLGTLVLILAPWVLIGGVALWLRLGARRRDAAGETPADPREP